MDRYGPLTPEELASASNPPMAPEKDDGWQIVAPVPDNAPKPPDKHPNYGKPKPNFRWQYRGESGDPLFWVWRFDPLGERKQFASLTLWRPPSNAMQWRWKAYPAPRPLYSLDKLAARPDAPVLICEGERCVDAAPRLFPDYVPTTSPGGSQAAFKADWTPLAGRTVTIWPDADESGIEYAAKVASILHGLGCRVSIIDAMALAAVAPDGGIREVEQGWDGADALPEWEPDALREAAADCTKPYEPGQCQKTMTANGESHDGGGAAWASLDAEITRLAKLSLAAYELERAAAAKRLGVRASILDRLVAAERPAPPAPANGRPLELPSPEPWPSPVDGAALVKELTAAIRKYVVLTANDALAVALWVLHTHCFNAFPCTPRLAITAPEKRCGKTTLLDVIRLLVPRALPTVSVTAAATFRTIETLRPVLLIDEADTFLGENEELRGILNSGHRAGGQVIRVVGDDHEPRMFSTHCPVAIAQIGKLPDTLADRSINVGLNRRAPGEKIARLRTGKTPDLDALARKAARWVADNAGAIRDCEPFIPDAIYNRAADNWEPLLTITEVIGGDVPQRARQLALESCGQAEEPSRGAMLLADIREIFAERSAGWIAGVDLIEALNALSDRPWCECNHDKSLTQNGLARALKRYGIRPALRRADGSRVRGYGLAQFEAMFTKYACSPDSPFSTATIDPQCVTALELNDYLDVSQENPTVPGEPGGTVAKSPLKSGKDNNINILSLGGSVGTVQTPQPAMRANLARETEPKGHSYDA